MCTDDYENDVVQINDHTESSTSQVTLSSLWSKDLRPTDGRQSLPPCVIYKHFKLIQLSRLENQI